MLSRQDKVVLGISHVLLILASLACAIPFLVMVSASITGESHLILNGYSLFPRAISFDAYKYLWMQGENITRSYGITVIVTAIGTSVSIIITCLLAYPLSMNQLPGRKVIMFLVVFAMLFNGGLVPTYIMYTQYFHLKNTIAALIVPGLLMRVFNVLLVRSYFISSVPAELIEAGRVDGCGEYGIFLRIVIPVSTPIIATIGLLTGLAYWNDWYNGLIFLTNERLYSLQVLLNAILSNVQYLAQNEVGARLTMALPATAVRMAIAAIAVIPVLVIYPFFQKYFVRSITMGAVKG
ncbi:sugar ABC transporter permease [Spirochaetia bacterium]|nr:sugar ABC transporter permease [Spirochaetia bacterium]